MPQNYPNINYLQNTTIIMTGDLNTICYCCQALFFVTLYCIILIRKLKFYDMTPVDMISRDGIPEDSNEKLIEEKEIDDKKAKNLKYNVVVMKKGLNIFVLQ